MPKGENEKKNIPGLAPRQLLSQLQMQTCRRKARREEL